MKILYKVIFTLLIMSGISSYSLAQNETELQKNLYWLQENIQEINKQAKEINLDFEYNLENKTCTYTYAQNAAGNVEIRQFIYTFKLEDIAKVNQTEKGVILSTKQEKALIELKKVNKNGTAPEIEKSRVNQLRIMAGTEAEYVKDVFEEMIEIAQSK